MSKWPRYISVDYSVVVGYKLEHARLDVIGGGASKLFLDNHHTL